LTCWSEWALLLIFPSVMDKADMSLSRRKKDNLMIQDHNIEFFGICENGIKKKD